MSDLQRGPAYRIETQRAVLRCYDPRDAPLLKAAVDASLGHLVPWLAWAREEPQSIAAKVELLRQFRGKFDLGQDYVYGIFAPGEAEVLGGCGFHARQGDGAREIGYWIAARHVGRGLATEAAAALVRVGFEVERLERIELHCDPANLASAAVARKLGFHHDGTLRARMPRRDAAPGDRMIWSLFAAEYEDGPCARAPISAYDAIGRRLLEPPAPSEKRRKSAFH